MSQLFRAACTGKSWQDGKEGSCPAAGGWSRCTSFLSTPFSDASAIFSPQAGPFFIHPFCASSPSLAEPNGSSSGCRERSPQPAWSPQAAAGRQTHFDGKNLLRSWDPTIQQLPAWLYLASRGKSRHTTLLEPAAGWKCLQPCYPARSCFTFVTSPATLEGWTESDCAQRVRGEEVSFRAV